MSQDAPMTAKARLAALEALVESIGWKLLTDEMKTRLERERIEACNLDRPGRKRAGSAGAANALESLLAYVPGTIDSLERKLTQESIRARNQKPPA